MIPASDPALDTTATAEVAAGASPPALRVTCEHAERCGGCPVLSLPYADQLVLKRGRVVQGARRYPVLELVHTERVLPAHPVVEYRIRAKLLVAPGGKVGLFAKGGGHQIVDIPKCRVLAPALARVAAYLRQRIEESEHSGGAFAPFDPTGPGSLRAVDLRETRNDGVARVLVTFVVQLPQPADMAALVSAAQDMMRELPDVVGVAANLHPGDSPQVLGSYTVTLAGVSSTPDRIGTSVHLATFGSFVQVHRGQAERVQRLLTAAIASLKPIGRTARVLDLYGGSGGIALGLAAAGASVRLVESFAPATAQARQAAREQSLDVDVHCSDVATALRSFYERSEHFDAAVVNPPRRGMSPLARESLARLAPSLVAYVSCDPETLARDLDHFSRLGYDTTSLRPLDMIPLTDEVETIAVLRRGGVPVPRVAYENDEVIVVEKSAHEPTVPQGEYTSSLLTRARRLPGAQNAVAVHRLDVGTSGLVVLARRPEHLAKWKRAISAPTTRTIYAAGVRGVTASKGTITRDLREEDAPQAARTRYRRFTIASGHSILRVVPDRERTHQIRRHLASIGHPVLGDVRYGHGPTNRHFEEKRGLDRTFLHLVRLEFDDPDTAIRVVAKSPLPGDLCSVLERIIGPETIGLLDHDNFMDTARASSAPPATTEVHPGPETPLDVDARSRTIRPELTDDEASAADEC
jgi:tRNA/tmRNA/rRNA uracil-C5-methylase (TrmA/RlmC/RlmD family)